MLKRSVKLPGEAQAGTRLWQAFPGEISGRNLWLEKVAETGLTE